MEGSLPPIKVILIGDTGVGKTSIIERFIHNQFDTMSSPSQGATFFSKDHIYGANKKVRLQVFIDLVRYGILLDNKNTSQSLKSIIGVCSTLFRFPSGSTCL